MGLSGSFVLNDDKVAAVCGRVDELREMHAAELPTRQRIRSIMNGGSEAMNALMGKAGVDSAPVANLMLSASTRLAQKLARPPDTKKDPPITSDSENAHRRAEKECRIVEWYDAEAKMSLQFPQIGRWLPGHGMCAVVVDQDFSRAGEPFPRAVVRDPYETYPGISDHVGGQPADIAFHLRVDPNMLAKRFPQHAEKILRGRSPRSRGGVLLGASSAYGGSAYGAGAYSDGPGVDVFEYLNAEGRWWVAPNLRLLLAFTPNVLSRPCFYLMKRFSFDKLTGQYDHVIGLMAAMARLNLLLVIATEESVLAETNVIGELAGGRYKKGLKSVNYFTPGTQIQKMNSRIPFEAFQYMSNLERQLRVVAGYAVTDDGNSPNSFVTGRGLEELSSSIDLEVREYHTVIADGMTEVDAIRLEWDDVLYADRERTMSGVRKGASYRETYTPRTAIKGDYVTRRVYGAMAGFDEPTKILTGLQLLQAELIDDDTMMENIDGLENHTRIKERVRQKKAEKVINDTLLAMAGQGDQRAMAAAIGMLPDSEHKTLLESIFLAEAEQPAEEEVLAMPDVGGPPDAATVMARLSSGAGGVTPTLSAQTVSQVA